MKISFDREEYLSVSSVFDNETLDDIETELSEFNEDVEEMAYELAYTRYALAKTERELAALKAAAVHIYNSGYHGGHHDTVEGRYVDIHPSDMDSYHDEEVAELREALAKLEEK